MKTYTYSEVLQSKISTFKTLSKLRKEQSKCFKYVTYIDLNGQKTVQMLYKNDKFEQLYKSIEVEISKIPDLYSLYGYVCTSKNGEIIQTWSIQLNNDLKDLTKKLKKEVK